MTKSLLCGVAAIAFTLAAPTAFAQDAEVDMKAKVKAEQMMEDAGDATEDAMDAVEDAAEETMDAAEDTAEETMDAADDTMDDAKDMMDDADEAVEDAMDDAAEDAMDSKDDMADDMKEEMADDTMAADVTATSSVTVACPEGTEAQADGSCMITGDWTPPSE